MCKPTLWEFPDLSDCLAWAGIAGPCEYSRWLSLLWLISQIGNVFYAHHCFSRASAFFLGSYRESNLERYRTNLLGNGTDEDPAKTVTVACSPADQPALHFCSSVLKVRIHITCFHDMSPNLRTQPQLLRQLSCLACAFDRYICLS
jgi:hypothetical protein